jgi:TolB-like protein/predicted Zn-dependent protease
VLVAVGAAVLAGAVLAIWSPWKKPAVAGAPVPVVAPPARVPVEPLSEARERARRAQALIEALDSTRDDYRLAEELIAQAKAKDATDAGVCAAEAHLHESFMQRGWDTSDARRESARSAVQRAMRLDPQSFEARFAQARLLGLVGREGEERERQLRELRRERPADQRILRALASVLDRLGRLEESAAIARESAALPGGDPLALYNLSQAYWFAGRAADAEAMIEASLAQKPFTGALLMNVWYKTTLRGDLAQARALIDRVDPTQLTEDRAAYFAYTTAMFARNPDRAIARLQAVPRDWLSDSWYRGPKGQLLGEAHQLAGRPDAARIEWQTALKLVEQRLAERPKDVSLLVNRVQLLAELGQHDEAARQLPAVLQIVGVDPERTTNFPTNLTYCFALMGRKTEAIRQIARFVKNSPDWSVAYPSATLRLDPRYDTLRGEPDFAAIIAEVEARERAIAAPTKPPGLSATEPAKADEKSVAVLAFANLSDDKANEYFSDGISEELLNVVAKVPGLKVTARTSAFHFKGKDTPIPEIARQLGVAYVIEGSVRKAGDKVRITAQLIKADDGFHVWSDTFTRELKDVFAVQDEIAALIAKQLSLKLSAGSAAVMANVSAEALELYVQARQAWNLRTNAGFARAEELLNRALVISPDFARAHAALADVWTSRGQQAEEIGVFGRRNSSVQQRVLAQIHRALALDGDCAEAHASLGIAAWNGWETPKAERALRRATQLNPNYASAHQWLGRVLMAQGKVEEALPALKLATELDPFAARIFDNYAIQLANAGRFAEARTAAARGLQIQPGAAGLSSILASIMRKLGRPDDAVPLQRAIDEQEGASAWRRAWGLALGGWPKEAATYLPSLDTRTDDVAVILALLGRTEEALAALNPETVQSINVDLWLFQPAIDPMRGDPRFRKFLETLGLTEAHARAQAWRAAHPPEKVEAKK